jgi:hypothetical protein
MAGQIDVYAFKTANGGNNLPRYDSIRRKDLNGVSSIVRILPSLDIDL